jgi:drug/metabolite transporter (DMT)-like permease
MNNRFFNASSGIFALVAVAIFYGITAVLARYLAINNDVFEQWYLRYGIAFLTSLIIFYGKIQYKKFLHLPKKEWFVLLIRVLIGNVAAVVLYTLAAQDAKIGPVAFMQAFPSLALLAVIIMHEKLTMKKGLLVLLSFVGVIIVVVENSHDLLSLNIGEIYSLISGVLFSFMFITRKWHTGILNNQEITIALLGLGFIANYLLSIIIYRHFFVAMDHWSVQFVAILFFASIAGVGNFFFLNYGFERVSGIIAGNILNLEQVFGPLFGYIFYHELLTSREIIGGVIILIAAVTMNIQSKKEISTIATPD